MLHPLPPGAVKFAGLAESAADREVEKKAQPRYCPAFDAEGKPTKAAEGWARGLPGSLYRSG